MKPQPQGENPNPQALTIPQLAELLTKSGRTKIAPASIAADVAAGAPANADGTINLLHYAAWLAEGQQ